MAIFSDGTGKKIEGKSIVTYRLKNTKNVDPKNLSEVKTIFITLFTVMLYLRFSGNIFHSFSRR